MAIQTAWAAASPEVSAQVRRLVAGLREILSSQLTGVYLHGSLALGGFNRARSDIDLLAVTRQALPAEQRRSVIELLLGCSGAPCPIEMSFLVQEDLQSWSHPLPYDLHFSEEWRERLAQEAVRPTSESRPRDPDLAAHINVTRARGACLFGAPIEQVFPPVPAEDYLDSIFRDLDWGRARLDQNPVYFVLNACRSLAYLKDGGIRSKVEGGAWAMEAFADARRGVVARALRAHQASDAPEELDPAELAEWAAWIAARIKTLAGSRGS